MFEKLHKFSERISWKMLPAVAAIVVILAATPFFLPHYFSQSQNPGVPSSSTPAVKQIEGALKDGVLWMTPQVDDCQPTRNFFHTRNGGVLSVAVTTQRMTPAKGSSVGHCHFELTISKGGTVIFKRSGDFGTIDGIEDYPSIGIASFTPGADQLIIAEYSCGGSCSGEDVKIVSFVNGYASEVFHFPASSLFPYEAARDLKWKVKDGALWISSSWYEGDKVLRKMSFPILFDPSTEKPIVSATRLEQTFTGMLEEPTIESYLSRSLEHLRRAESAYEAVAQMSRELQDELKPLRDNAKQRLACEAGDDDCLTSRAQMVLTASDPMLTQAYNILMLSNTIAGVAGLENPNHIPESKSAIEELLRHQDDDDFANRASAILKDPFTTLFAEVGSGTASAKVAMVVLERGGVMPAASIGLGRDAVSKGEAVLSELHLARLCILATSPQAMEDKCDSTVENPEADIPEYMESIQRARAILTPVAH